METPLRHRDFALLWTAGLVSITGDWMLLVAVPMTVLTLTGSSTATGAAVAAALIPRIVVAPIAGVLVDRWDRRRALVGANLLQVLFVLPLAAVNDAGDVWIVIASTLAMGCVAQVLLTAENALLPTLVPATETGRANALNTLNNNLGRLIGPAIGGLLAASAGIDVVAVTDAATFLVAAALIALVGVRRPSAAPDRVAPAGPVPAGRWRIWTDLRTGLAVIRATRPLRVIFVFLAIADAVRGRVFGTALTVMSLIGLCGTGLAAALGDRLGPVTLLNVQGIGLMTGGLFVIAALRPAVSGVTPATERTLMSAGRSG